ncbi:hypothetical protein JW978_03730 [Candidatus Dojkabacteria bacterium]|nr:hypothetical protein [Candidatus Dojkabacteria bacterium]
MDLSDIKKYRSLIIVLGVIVFLLVILSALISDGTKRESNEDTVYKEQDPAQIEDIKSALPYVEEEYRLSYSQAEDLFVVTYPGYKTVDEMEVKTISWLKEYTDYSNVKVKYGEIGGEIRSYDMTKNTTELLKNNTYLTYSTSGSFGYSN